MRNLPRHAGARPAALAPRWFATSSCATCGSRWLHASARAIACGCMHVGLHAMACTCECMRWHATSWSAACGSQCALQSFVHVHGTNPSRHPALHPRPPTSLSLRHLNEWQGGIFGDLAGDINCGELTPLDTYEMAIFGDTPSPAQFPRECALADPDGDRRYCQILGQYRNALPHFNTVPPFAHMRERCPSMAPAYAERFSAAVDRSC